MKDYLFCNIKNCNYKIGVDINATVEECERAIKNFKQHMKMEHSLDELVEHLFNLIMIMRGESMCFQASPNFSACVAGDNKP